MINKLSLTFTITSLPSLACRLKCAISGLSPVSICLYIWWQVSISCTARSIWSPGRPLWAPRARVPGRKHTRWSCRVRDTVHKEEAEKQWQINDSQNQPANECHGTFYWYRFSSSTTGDWFNKAVCLWLTDDGIVKNNPEQTSALDSRPPYLVNDSE